MQTEDEVARTASVGAMLSSIMLLAGCGSDTPPDVATEPTTELAVTGTDRIEFEPAEFAIPGGEEVTLEFSAGEAVEHDFVVAGAADVGTVRSGAHGDEGPPIESDDLAVAHADPGQAAAATFVIDEPGTYEVYCSVPGHREAGMVATLTVVPGT